MPKTPAYRVMPQHPQTWTGANAPAWFRIKLWSVYSEDMASSWWSCSTPFSRSQERAIDARVRAHKISRMPEYAKLTSAKIDKPSIVGGYPMNTATWLAKTASD